jgi:hypothetical protein
MTGKQDRKNSGQACGAGQGRVSSVAFPSTLNPGRVNLARSTARLSERMNKECRRSILPPARAVVIPFSRDSGNGSSRKINVIVGAEPDRPARAGVG